LEALARQIGGQASVEDAVTAALDRYGPPGERTWVGMVDDLGRMLGRRVSWQVGPAAEVRQSLSEESVAVGWGAEGWTVLRCGSAWRWPGEFAVGQVDESRRAWAVLEPALPGSALSASGAGDPVWKAVGRVAALIREERRDVYLVASYAAAVTALGLATPVAVQVLVNTVAFGSVRLPVWGVLGLLALCLTAAAGLRLLQVYVVELVQRRLFVRFVTDLAERLPRLRLEVFGERRPAELVHRFFDLMTAQKALASLLVDGVEAMLQTLVALALLAVYHPMLIGLDVLVLAGMGALLVLPTRRAAEAAFGESKQKYAIAGLLDEVVMRPELYRQEGGPELVMRRADDLAHQWMKYRHKQFGMFAAQYGGALALQAFTNVALLGVGAWLVLDGGLSLGQLVAAEFIVASALIGFAKFSGKLESAYDLLAAVDKVGVLVDLPVEPAGGVVSRAEGAAAVRLSGVVGHGLAGVDLMVTAGERLAVLSEPGPARHALAEVLSGLWRPTQGKVLWDGVDADDVHLPSWRARAPLVRESEVVPGSLSDNITFGRSHVGREAVGEAVRAAGLEGAVSSLPGGLDTALGPHGEPLDESDRLRLVVARVVAGAPRLVVVDGLLDRPEVAMPDPLLSALWGERGARTVVLFTRDRSLAARCDRVLRIEDGRLRPVPVRAS
jgi:ABC-type bacteriocin/lantibiotic exporter with double-glycine peptidase domain